MTITITPLHPVFVGEVAGADLTRPQAPDEVQAIEAGMDQYAVLVFRDQAITDEQQKAFTVHFGALENYNTGGHIRKRSDSRLGPGVADFSNLDREGRRLRPDDRVWLFKLGDRLWHSDSSFRPIPATYSLLSARMLPSWGGNTEFADMRAAYDALDERTKARIEDLVCHHSLLYSRRAIGFAEMTAEEIESFRPVRQRLVRRHPVTGRKSLYLSSHAGAIEGWTVPEAQLFLRDLTEHATQPRFVYSHAWRPHDLVMWDNRMTMHRARPFDAEEIRDVRRTTIGGTVPTIEPSFVSPDDPPRPLGALAVPGA
jgi:alpha-ketoglutarate-dependent 2,4-dichlorophenoxyacetate dioxygenase